MTERNDNSEAKKIEVHGPEAEADEAIENPADPPQADVPAEEASQEPPADAPQAGGADDLRARLQRLAADYQNYKKRAAKEKAQAREFANEDLLKELVPVIDDMERALAAASENHGEDDPFLAGMQLVHDKTLEVLRRFGLTTIDAVGKPFDPDRHSALMQEVSETVEPMTVLREVQTGYDLKGRTLRPTGVVVSKAPE
jgi:molecular chaperone GrpE